jgi:cell division protein ZapA
MSQKISIKVVVAGRTYPLTVNAGEEAKIQKAADDINRSIKLLQENYAVKDMQDLLAMTTLQLATKSANNASQPTPSLNEIHSNDELERVSEQLEKLLSEIEQSTN